MKNKKKIIITVIIIFVVILGVFIKMRLPKEALTPPMVKVERRDLSNKIAVLGTIETSSKQEIYPASTGIVKYAAQEGDEVKQGDVIFEMDQEELIAESGQIESKLSQQRAELERLLNGPRPEEIEKANLRLEEVQNAFASSEELYKQNLELFDSGAISEKELEASKNGFDKAKIQLSIARLDIDILENPDKTEVEIKQSMLKETRERFAQIQDQISKTIVTAEQDGLILHSTIRPGMMVSPGSMVMMAGNPSDLNVIFGVNEYDSAKLKVGLKAYITGEGFYGSTYEGVIVKIAPIATQAQGSRGIENSVKVTLEVLDPDDKIKPGFTATVEIIAEEKSGTLILPLESVTEEDGIKKVLALTNGETVEKIVKTGIRNELYVEILDGIEEGEEVLRYPSTYLQDVGQTL